MKSRAQSLDEQIKTATDEQTKKAHEDTRVLVERDAGRLEAQLKQLDVEVEGAKKSAEYPDGVDGIMQQVDQLQEVKIMLKDWIKKV